MGILWQHNYVMRNLTMAQPGSVMSYGLKFRIIEFLYPLLHLHPLWSKIVDSLTTWVKFLVLPLDKHKQKFDAEWALKHKNHKSAFDRKQFLVRLLVKEFIAALPC